MTLGMLTNEPWRGDFIIQSNHSITLFIYSRYMHYPSWESRPSVTALTSEAALVLLNSHVSVGYAFPKPPHFKEIGGVNVVPSKPLPQVRESV